MLHQIVETLAPYSATVITLLMSWGVYELNQYIRSRTRHEAAIAAMDTLGTIAQTTVQGIAQTAAGSLADGRFTKAEATELKQLAVETIKAQITPALDKHLALAVNDLDTFIASRIEAAVLNVKIAKAAAGLPEHNMAAIPKS